MKAVYGVLIIIEILALGVCALKAEKRRGKLAKIVFCYESLAFLCGIIFAVYTFVPGVLVTTLCKGLTLACFDWLLILLMYYTQYYTGLFHGVRSIKILLEAYAALETVMLIANAWTHHMFSVGEITGDMIAVEFVKGSFFYQMHFIYSYVLIAILILAYLFMIARASKFYRFRYEVILSALVVGFVLDLLSIHSQSIYDVSMIMFGVMSMLIYYFTFSYVPNELIESTLSLIIRDMNSGIICFDNRGTCVYCNDLVRELYQVSGRPDVLEKMYRDWLSDSGEKRTDSMQFQMPVEEDGKERYYEIVYKRVYDDKNNFVCDCFIFNDRTEEIESLEHEKYRASHDRLTGLLNREQFYLDTSERLHQNPDKKYCIICSNIRDFKFVNELFGIEKGNDILLRQAELMRTHTGAGALCARLQGDRFAVCMEQKAFREEMLFEVVEKIQEEVNNSSFRLHVFAGVYNIQNPKEPVSIMCDKANLASETIKNDYHSSLAYYDDELLKRSIEERRIIGEFERALEQNEFVMFLQPQVDEAGKAYGAEALVRWEHPERGLLSPAVFIDILEKAGLIYKLDRYIWEKAAEKLAEWKKNNAGAYHISVNISTKDFYLVDVYETFTGLVQKYEIDPEMLKLEITETALMSDFKKNMEILKRLQDFGFKIEIDDFGSGYSSLNMLKDISADVLKIDMGFLRASENEVKGKDILESIIVLADKLGMEVITEGVETEKQLSMLTRMGCKMFQGYYFSRPVPVDEFEEKYGIN